MSSRSPTSQVSTPSGQRPDILSGYRGRGWIEARSLAAGDLLTASVGVRTIVLGVRDAGYRTALFDIEVEDLQACFAGNHGVCVQAFCPSRP